MCFNFSVYVYVSISFVTLNLKEHFLTFRAGPGWNCSSFLVLLESCLQTCMTYTTAECTVNELLMMDKGTVRKM